jgi:methylase of polypeptide subunit release factors
VQVSHTIHHCADDTAKDASGNARSWWEGELKLASHYMIPYPDTVLLIKDISDLRIAINIPNRAVQTIAL